MLDGRSIQVIRALTTSSYVLKQDIMKEVNLTKRQLEYTMDKINGWIKDNKYQPVRFIKEKASIDHETYTFLLKRIDMDSDHFDSQYLMDRQERMNFIYMMIFLREGYLSINHFVDALEVSKATIFKDLGDLKNDLEEQNIGIEYNRLEGYNLSGDELDLRAYLLKIVLYSLAFNPNRKFIDYFIETNQLIKFEEMLSIISSVMRKHDIKFVENRLIEFTYSFILLKQRLLNHAVIIDEHIDAKDLMNTDEYEFSLSLLKYFDMYTESSSEYLSRCVLGFSAGIHEITNENRNNVMKMVRRFLNRFESFSGIVIEQKEDVIAQLYIHFQPAYYRLLFRIPVYNPLLEKIKSEYSALFTIVKETFKSFEKELDRVISEDELSYLTIHFASIISNFSKQPEYQKVAAIVCSNGIGSSMLLYSRLKSIFPEFIFMEPIEFINLDSVFDRADIIFTTINQVEFVKEKKPYFVVSPVMTDAEISDLISEVYSKINNFQYQLPSFNQMINIVKKYVPEKEFKEFENEIRGSIVDDLSHETYGKVNLELSDIILKEYIQLDVTAHDKWDAVEKAANPLKILGAISEEYINEIKKSMETNSEYLVISNSVAMPHAKPKYGVNKTAMGITVLAKPVKFGNNNKDPVKYIFTLGSIDKESHLKAMSTFIQLISEDSFFEKLNSSNTALEVKEYINDFEARINTA